jgi:hypothetical protein
VIATVNHTDARQESRPMSQSNCDLVLGYGPVARFVDRANLTGSASITVPYFAFQRRKSVFKGFPDKPALLICKTIKLVHRLRRGSDVELCRASSSCNGFAWRLGKIEASEIALSFSRSGSGAGAVSGLKAPTSSSSASSKMLARLFITRPPHV